MRSDEPATYLCWALDFGHGQSGYADNEATVFGPGPSFDFGGSVAVMKSRSGVEDEWYSRDSQDDTRLLKRKDKFRF